VKGSKPNDSFLSAARAEKSGKFAARRHSVAIIDPDVAIAAAVRELLETLSIDVRVYDSAEAYLQCVGTRPAGCVITAAELPGLSGLELLRQLRERQPGLPVIVLSGEADVPTAVSAMRDGATDFIEKPDVRLALMRRVTQLMRSQPERYETFGDDLH
jgi:FixJ family two-component response regulator